MKKITLSILAFGAFILTAQAQTPEVKNESKDVKFGAKLGLNFSNLTNDDEAKTLTSFHLGAIAEFFVSDKFSIQPEILYSRQGAKASMTQVEMGTTIDIDAVMKLDYINIPIMAKYYIKDGFSFQVGPQVGFLVGAEVDIEASAMGVTIETTESIKSQINSVDFGVNFGLGYELPVGLCFDARYNFGITKVNSESFEGMKNSQNSVFQLSVGYKF